MTLRPGDVVAGRFEVRGAEATFQVARARAREDGGWDDGAGTDSLQDPDIWLRGIDRHTGASVLFEPRGNLRWECALAIEAIARHVKATSPPFTADVLHVERGVVYSEPPPSLPREIFSRREAAVVALQACETAARLHAAGIARLYFGAANLRVRRDADGVRIRWLVPGVADFEERGWDFMFNNSEAQPRRFHPGLDGIEWDVRHVINLFFNLQPRKARLLPVDRKVNTLWGMLKGGSPPLPRDMATLARLLVPLAAAPADMAARVAALPSVASLPAFRYDWNPIIAEGEATLAEMGGGPNRNCLSVSLAMAYHQRASRAWTSGDRGAALADTKRAVELDSASLSYKATHAIIYDALGRGDEAYGPLHEAITLAEADCSRRGLRSYWSDLGRAYGARGMIALRAGRAAEAKDDLQRAMEFRPTAAHAHGLSVALYALGDIQGAVGADTRAVLLSPANTRYRWALVASLRRLGRDAEALAQAEEIVALDPENASHREKLLTLTTPSNQRRRQDG